jgi:hypothetical protein
MSVILNQLPHSDHGVQVDIHITADLNISAYVARRQVTTYLIDQVSDHLCGEDPELIVDGERFLWRVPVALYLTAAGRVGQVGTLDIDAQTGQLQTKPELLTAIERRAHELATRSAA